MCGVRRSERMDRISDDSPGHTFRSSPAPDSRCSEIGWPNFDEAFLPLIFSNMQREVNPGDSERQSLHHHQRRLDEPGGLDIPKKLTSECTGGMPALEQG